jgi:hypothetical protein
MTIARTIKIQANATYVLSVRWYDVTNDEAFLLSDAWFQVREEKDSPEAIIDANVDNGLIILDDIANGGWCTVWIPSSAMQDLSYYGGAKYDLVIKRSIDGEEKTALEGDAVVWKGITQHG